MKSEVFQAIQEIEGLSKQLEALGYPTSRMKRFPCESEESIRAVEMSTGMSVPAELRKFLQTVGGMYLRIDVDGLAITYYDRPTCPQPIGGLADVLDGCWMWNEYREEDELPEDAIETLNREFVCFGHCECTENSSDHFFYDRNGKLGVLHFDQEFLREDAWEHLLQLCTGTNPQPAMSLDEILLARLPRAKSTTSWLLDAVKERIGADGG